jgi:hypothetical protein
LIFGVDCDLYAHEYMRRFFGLRIVFIFLVAIASNCLQNALITLEPTQTAHTVADASKFFKNSASESLFTDDESGNDALYVASFGGTVLFSSRPNIGCLTSIAFYLTDLAPIYFSQHLQI